MNIETRFNIGQEVFFLRLSKDGNIKIHSDIVESIRLDKSKYGTNVYYYLVNSGYNACRESALFSNHPDLFNIYDVDELEQFEEMEI